MAAVQYFTPISTGIRTASEALVVKAAATALTTSYVAFPSAGNEIVVTGWEWVKFKLTYTNGDETSIQWYVEGYDGVSWGPALFKATQAAAVAELTPDVYNVTKATINTFVGGTTATAFYHPAFDVLAFQQIRIKVKSTGGTPTGTLAISATAGIGISGRSA